MHTADRTPPNSEALFEESFAQFDQVDKQMLDTLRFVILRDERKRYDELYKESDEQNKRIAQLEELNVALLLRFGDDSALTSTIEPIVVPVIGRQIEGNKERMAKTMGPIIGDSIRAQLRDNRADIIDALYPIIGDTVGRSVRESIRAFQRSIDERLRKSRDPQNIRRNITARFQGVSPSEMALRDSLPFTIHHIFLIQHNTGLLLAHQQNISDSEMPPGLIGGMLTAIRAFARDAFGNGKSGELDEIQYGDQRIIIEAGQYVYVAAVSSGTEPVEFREELRSYISNLHMSHHSQLRDYNGEMSTVTPIQENLSEFVEASTQTDAAPTPIPVGSANKLVGALAFLMILGLASAVFCTVFTVKLWPYAFGTIPTPTYIIDLDSLSEPWQASISANSWAFNKPDTSSTQTSLLEMGTIVTVLSSSDDWAEIAWSIEDENRSETGWLRHAWLRPIVPISETMGATSP